MKHEKKWNEYRLKEICNFLYGKGLPKRDRIKGEYPVYGSSGIVDYHKDFVSKGPGIIVGRKGTIGSVFYEKNDFYPIDTVYYIEENKDIFKKYLYYLLKNMPLQRLNNDAAVPGLNRKAALSQKAYLPSINLQKKIAEILSAYDELIENNNRRIEILEKMAEKIYKEWFVHFRFPGHEKVNMIDSELGKIPEGWKVKKLSEIVNTQYGYTESASEKVLGPKFLRGKDINKNSYIVWSDVPYCKIENILYKKFKLSKGDIVVIRMADPGKVGIIEKNTNAVFASYLIRLKIKNGIDPYYIFYFMLSGSYQSYISGASTGTTRKSASAKVVANANIILPENSILNQFVKHIKPVRSLLNTLLEKNEILKKTRDILLPKLISGTIDVSDLDIKIEEKK
jgi:type I restriction enzyme, S subunit